MGTVAEPKPVKYFVAFLFSDSEILRQVESDLVALLGNIDGRSEIVHWQASKFYDNEMGSGLRRGLLSFLPLVSPENLAAIKLQTRQIEDRWRVGSNGGRRVNLDPGYLDAFKIVLASTKNAGQRVYLRSGIYGEATLMYHDGQFHGLPYTYRDYLWPETLAFLTQLRSTYLRQRRELG
jgi:hypothetical protein